MEFGSFDVGNNVEHDGDGFVEIFEILVQQNLFFFGSEPFDST